MDNEDFLKLIESLLSPDKEIAGKALVILTELRQKPNFYSYINAVLNTSPRIIHKITNRICKKNFYTISSKFKAIF